MVVDIVNDGLPTNNQVFEPNLSQNEGTMESRANQSALSQNPSVGDGPGFGYNGFYGTGSSTSVNDPYCWIPGFRYKVFEGIVFALFAFWYYFSSISVPCPF